MFGFDLEFVYALNLGLSQWLVPIELVRVTSPYLLSFNALLLDQQHVSRSKFSPLD